MATGATPLALTGPTTPGGDVPWGSTGGQLTYIHTPGGGQGGRRPTGPTVNPRAVTNFEDVTGIPFMFARHPVHNEAHIHMNAIYSDAFMDMDDLFIVTDPPTRTTFVADPVAIIKNKI